MCVCCLSEGCAAARSAHLCAQANLENSSLATRGARKTTHIHGCSVLWPHRKTRAFLQFVLGKKHGQCCHLVVSVISGGSVTGSSRQLADDTNESSVLVFQPLVISAQVNEDLWREEG